ncbi:hypothetical protein LCM02_00975 [Lutimonas saemankumensis]|uniref:hypothetical protein n=1 Tax=Lutimonas saemankumensis TaxID=483016 RepID=UPI001CD53FC4|nr:hypothetical protein [Lutimonas saemankumensis]MCA0931000.1 hypothetical protein [Lutimonas saemankumensis]
MNPFRKILSLGLIILFIQVSFAQNELDPYKYIIIPKKYEFLNKENQFRVNSYMKHLFEKEGYNTIYQGENYPDDLLENPCLGVKAMVSDQSSAFTTKVFIFLENCQDEVVFKTAQGKSKVKDMNKTYVDALNKCFVEIQSLDYTYNSSLAMNSGRTEESKIDSNQESVVTAEKETVLAKETPEKDLKNESSGPAVKESETASAKPVAEPVAVPIVAIATTDDPVEKEEAVAVEVNEVPEKEEQAASPMARAFKNESISFLLVDQGAQLQAFVTQSQNSNYRPGELIGTFKRTSLPNVFRVSWKEPQEGREETTAYFDDAGNLNIDVLKDGQIQVIQFKEEK